MEKKYVIALIVLMLLLILCIALMGISLLVGAWTFRQVSGYLAIASIGITIFGVAIIMRANRGNKGE